MTWSPDARQLLLDYETRHQWRLLDASGRGSARILPRLGGRPLWCCPQQEYFSNH